MAGKRSAFERVNGPYYASAKWQKRMQRRRKRRQFWCPLRYPFGHIPNSKGRCEWCGKETD